MFIFPPHATKEWNCSDFLPPVKNTSPNNPEAGSEIIAGSKAIFWVTF